MRRSAGRWIEDVKFVKDFLGGLLTALFYGMIRGNMSKTLRHRTWTQPAGKKVQYEWVPTEKKKRPARQRRRTLKSVG
jgi:hypothetical protein